jgi:hypothetical protein
MHTEPPPLNLCFLEEGFSSTVMRCSRRSIRPYSGSSSATGINIAGSWPSQIELGIWNADNFQQRRRNFPGGQLFLAYKFVFTTMRWTVESTAGSSAAGPLFEQHHLFDDDR